MNTFLRPSFGSIAKPARTHTPNTQFAANSPALKPGADEMSGPALKPGGMETPALKPGAWA